MININVIYNGKNNKINEQLQIEKGTRLIEIKEKFNDKFEFPVNIAKINNENLELFNEVNSECEIEFLDITNIHSYLVYKRSVLLLMINSIRKILGEETQIRVKYSISQNWYCDIKDTEITESLLLKIKEDMKSVVSKNLKIEKITVPIKEGVQLLKKYRMYDRANGLRYVRKSNISLYRLENTYDYLYGGMALSTGELGKFELIKNKNNSFTLCFGKRDDFNQISEYKNIENLVEVFEESAEWAKIVGVDYVEALNSAICDEKIKEIILISEALQEKKIANIADMITEQKKKIVLVAGPSSSGKTTFANRLCIQLKVNGVKPYIISLDDYYLSQHQIPIGEDGKPDYECLEALDVEQINQDMEMLLKGEVVDIPKFNFTTGLRQKGKSIKLDKDEVIIIEGIHGLNEKISAGVPKESKFKVFISALTQLNIDSHNRIPTTDARMFRRIVRDHYFRGFGVKETIDMWSDVLKGEVKHIFPYQKEADVIFNSSLIYELAVLKPLVEPLLYKISNDEEGFTEATRLIKFLDSFLPIVSLEAIPSNSIIREFIGGSCF